MCPWPPNFPRVPNIRLRVSPDVQNLPPMTRSRDNGSGPYYPSGPYSLKFPYIDKNWCLQFYF